jgi:hypothetical protein
MEQNKWNFAVLTRDGTRIKPLQAELGGPYKYANGITDEGATRSDFTVIFPSVDEETKRPLIDPSDRSITLAIGSDLGVAAARFTFKKK